jgi:hypothetical protein
MLLFNQNPRWVRITMLFLHQREHNVRPSLVLHDPWRRGPDYRDDDIVLFVSLEGIDVGRGVLPGEACSFQDRVPLGVVGGDGFEYSTSPLLISFPLLMSTKRQRTSAFGPSRENS